jgi:indole-3-acetate monooxygenase
MATTFAIDEETFLKRLRDLEPLIRSHAGWSEQHCRMHPDVFQALSDGGFFSLWKPTGIGGSELDALSGLRLFEAATRIEPAVGWVIANQTGIDTMPGSMLPAEGASEVLADPAKPLAGGWYPPGRADVVPGGYRLTGQWSFASTCHYAGYLTGMGVIHDNGDPRIGADGSPGLVIAWFDAKDATIIDNWDTIGMRGTGSNDIAVHDVFVLDNHAWQLAPIVGHRHDPFAGPLYGMFPWLQISSLGPVGIGIAQAALDALIELATAKTPSYLTKTLREKEVAQSTVGRAAAMVGAARTYLHTSVSAMWDTARVGVKPSLAEGVAVQLATTNALETGARVVNLVHDTVGTTGIRNSERFQQLYRDGHTISQHAFGALGRYESCGKVLLGLTSDWGFFYV